MLGRHKQKCLGGNVSHMKEKLAGRGREPDSQNGLRCVTNSGFVVPFTYNQCREEVGISVGHMLQ